MDKKEIMTEYLNGVYQNIKTAVQSIEDILPKVQDNELRKELSNQQDKYAVLQKECELLAKAEKIDGIKDNSWFEKAKLWSSINMSTISNKSNRKIAELMLMGTFMGIITCEKDRHDHKNISTEIDEILRKLRQLEEDNIDNLIPYLV
ncbi:MAG: hypothetical protein E7379_02125 [Clostridiales bacterium]|nr:hypothetical protein [Clostridiales bacterium]